jgi:hypothetical protein
VVNGVATRSLSGTEFESGTYSVSALYSGSATFSSSASGEVLLRVHKASTTLEANDVAGSRGSMVALSATVHVDSPSVAIANQGTVTFTISAASGKKVGTVTSGRVAGGPATAGVNLTGLAPGAYRISAKCNAGSDFGAAATRRH